MHFQQEVSARPNSTIWHLIRPLRMVGHQIARGKHLVEIADSAFQLRGGLGLTLRRAMAVYGREGFAGVLRGFRMLRTGGHANASVGVNAMDKERYLEWVKVHDTLDAGKRSKWADLCKGFVHQPKISVLLPIHNPMHGWLVETIASVKSQIYGNWELCIAAAASTDPAIRFIVEKYSNEDKRIKAVFRTQTGHAPVAANMALELATGEWIALLDQHDLLAETAFCRIVDAINKDSHISLIYSDEDKVDNKGDRCNPIFKPDWSPHYACTQAYLGRLFVFNAMQGKPRFDENSNGSQDYGLWLSIASGLEHDEIHHVSSVLYHQRITPAPTANAASLEKHANQAGLEAVNKFIFRKYRDASLFAKYGKQKFIYSLERRTGAECLISIIIPTKDKMKLLSACIDSIRRKSSWRNFEIIIINNNSVEKSTFAYFEKIKLIDPRVKVVNAPIDFNWSKLNNIGIASAKGEVYVFLNNDTVVIEESWLAALSTYALLPDVGLVGGLLTYEDGSLQHSGVVVGMGGWADHIFSGQAATHTSNSGFVSPVVTRNVLAVTGACMAISKKKMELIGLFDENFIICGSDVEICIRAYKRGYFNVMCAEARLFHFESKTRSSFVPEVDIEQSRIKYAPYRTEKIDPFFNANLSLNTTYISLKQSPRDSQFDTPDVFAPPDCETG